MKKLNFLCFTAALSLFTILFSSCTKDSLSKSQPSNSFSSGQVSNSSSPNSVNGTGDIQASIYASSAIRTSLVVYNDNYTSGEVATDADGNVVIKEIPEGSYTAVAHAYFIVPNYDPTSNSDVSDQTITITNVKIVADQITDLGTIKFGQ